MEEEVRFCENCKRDISAKNFLIHSAHCERKIQLCDRCSEPVPRSELKKHEEEFHSPETCSDCCILLEKWQIEKHKETCAKKLVACEYCELELPLDNVSEHMVACGSRTELCLKCKKHVMLKDLELHHIKCLRRKQQSSLSIPCKYCGDLFPLEFLDDHAAFCRSQTQKCKTCNRHIELRNVEAHSIVCQEKQELKLNFPCKHCGDLFPQDILEDHTATCGSETQKCERCNRYIELKTMKTHLYVCQENSAALKDRIPCMYCKHFFPHSTLNHHIKTCGSRTEKCGKCGNFIRLNESEEHQCIPEKNISKARGNCPVCHESVPWVEMNVHTAMCAQMHYETDDYERQNELNEHALRKESDVLKNKSFEERKPKLLEETKRCPFCFELFPYRSFPHHLEECLERPYNCEKCLKAMPYRKKEEHVYSCSQQTQRRYPNDYMLHHEETDGDGSKELKQLKKCQFCNKRFPDVLFQPHMEECEYREEKCNHCAENVRVKDMQEHKLLKCFPHHAEKKTFNNRNNMHSEAIPEHSKNFDRMRPLEENVEMCPSCGCKIPEERYNKHINLCYEERTECHFCGKNIQKKSEHEHFKNCEKILEMVKEDRNSLSKQKKRGQNERTFSGKSIIGGVFDWFSNKEKKLDRKNSSEAFGKSDFWQPNRRQSNERGNMTPVQQPATVELPCEFCNEMWPFEFLIEHQSGCRPDLVSFPKSHKESDDQKFAAAAATTPILGASVQSTPEEDGEWKVQSKRNRPGSGRENMGMKERSVSQKLSSKEKFFYYSPQGLDEFPKNQPSSTNKKRYPQLGKSPEIPKKKSPELRKSPEISKKRYPQLKKSPEIPKKQSPELRNSPEIPKKRSSQWRESPETSETKPDEEIGASHAVRKEDPKKDQFISFKFNTSRYNEELQLDINSEKQIGDESSTDTITHEETKRSDSATESYSGLDVVQPHFKREVKAVGAERNRIMHSKKDFAEMSLSKSVAFVENNNCKVSESSGLNLSMPAIFNTEYNSGSDKICNHYLMKSFHSDDDNEAKDNTLSKAIEDTEHRTLNSSIQDADYDEKNAETFGSDFVESINNNLNKDDDTLSNSDDTFYDADDGGAKLVDIVNENVCCSSNAPEEKLSHYDFNDLNSSCRQQRENLNPGSYGDLNVGVRQLEDDLNYKDSDLNGYFQFLFKSKKQPVEPGEGEKVSFGTVVNQKTSSPNACSSKDASCNKNCSEPMDMDPFIERTRASIQVKTKNISPEFRRKEKIVNENIANDEEAKWRKWRTTEASDSE